MEAATDTLRDAVAARRWYHTLELPGGVTTPGEYDMRGVLDRVPLPASLAGKRCLDVGTHDGFWAFEMERRGASEVVAIDLEDVDRLDFPRPRPELTDEMREEITARKQAFWVAHALGSQIEHRNLSVYDLDPDVVGTFDFITLGTLLLHLRDPAGALMAVNSVADGYLLVNEPVSLSLTLLRPRAPAAKLIDLDREPLWWVPNSAALGRLVRAAGFEFVDIGGPYLVPHGAGYDRRPLQRGLHGHGLLRQFLQRRGMPHVWILGRSRTEG